MKSVKDNRDQLLEKIIPVNRKMYTSMDNHDNILD